MAMTLSQTAQYFDARDWIYKLNIFEPTKNFTIQMDRWFCWNKRSSPASKEELVDG
jgi:hypothetical protein